VKLAVLLLVFSCVAEAAKDGKAPAPAPAAASSGFTRGGSGRVDPRNAGPLDPSRKINEQDCSKPIDLTAGNLKCK
jgi:hypothetical protein